MRKILSEIIGTAWRRLVGCDKGSGLETTLKDIRCQSERVQIAGSHKDQKKYKKKMPTHTNVEERRESDGQRNGDRKWPKPPTAGDWIELFVTLFFMNFVFKLELET